MIGTHGRRLAARTGVSALLLAACGGDGATAPATPTGVQVLAGAGVSDTVQAARTPDSLVVQVRSQDGAAARAMVQFEVRAPADSLRAGELQLYLCPLPARACGPTAAPFAQVTDPTRVIDTTDADGVARAGVRFGTVAGPAYVIVSVPEYNLRDSVRMLVQPGAARSIRITVPTLGVTIGGTTVFRATTFDRLGNARTDPATLSYAGTLGVATFDPATGALAGQAFGMGYVYARAGALVDSSLVQVLPPGRVVGWNTSTDMIDLVTLGAGVRSVARGTFESSPKFAPAGGTLAFEDGSGGIGIVDTLGSKRRGVDPLPDLEGPGAMVPRPTADGRVYFLGVKRNMLPPYGTVLYRADSDGTITTVATLPGFYADADIAPDGSKVAYVAQEAGQVTGVRVLTAATGRMVTIDISGRTPSWSADGTRLAYVTGDPLDGRAGHLVLNAPDGSARTQLTVAGLYSGGGIAWSPDGAYVIAQSTAPIRGPRLVRLRDGVSVPLSLGQSGNGSFLHPDWR